MEKESIMSHVEKNKEKKRIVLEIDEVNSRIEK
jgi:hypothetical protein